MALFANYKKKQVHFNDKRSADIFIGMIMSDDDLYTRIAPYFRF